MVFNGNVGVNDSPPPGPQQAWKAAGAKGGQPVLLLDGQQA